MNEIIENKYGFYEVKNKPSLKELQAYYADKYYQEGLGSYAVSYDDDEIQYFFNKIEQKFAIANTFLDKESGKILDVGSGEGFALKFFDELGWDCVGLDFSNFGIKANNPKQQDLLIVGDIFDNIEKIIASSKMFDLIWLDNVLEHVIDPLDLLKKLYKIINNGGILVVDVPNDFSVLHRHLLKEKYIHKEFWVSPPDHLSYFSKDGLTNIAQEAGFHIKKTIADHPIDLDLLSPNSNYVENKNLGKDSHKKRIDTENLLHSISIEKTNKFYEELANLGLGRSITSFFTKV